MKVLHINCNYLGTTLHQLMIERLNSLGIENTVFVPTFKGTKKVIIPNENVIVSNCFNKWDRVIFQYKQKKILKAIDGATNVRSFDILHAYTLFTDGNVAYKLSKKYCIPYVVAVRNTDVFDFFAKMVHLRHRGVKIMRNAKKIFFLSKSYQDMVFEKYVPEKYREELSSKVEIIPNGIDDYWFDNMAKPRELTDAQNVELFSACIVDKNKNIAATQQAMKLLEKEGITCHLTVAGNVVDKKVYQRLLSDKNTTFLPNQLKENLLGLYRKSDIFVMPSFHETFGLVYVEAMTQGLPVIYTEGQGFYGQFDEGIVGYAVNPNDCYDIAQKIKKVIEVYQNFRNQNEFSLRYDWGSIADKYERIYRAIL